MLGGLFAVIVLAGYRYWFGGQEAEELAVLTTTTAPVSAPRTIEIDPAATVPEASTAPYPAIAVDHDQAPAAPAHKWQYRPLSETTATNDSEEVVVAVPETSTVSTPASAPPAGQPTAAPVARPTTGYGNYRQQQTWPQPYYPPQAYPGYQYRYR
jgi:hypothetical protein